MADVTGPISTLAGAIHSVPENTVCDDHPERPAYRRVQGETDSFGSELLDMCEECYYTHKAAVEAHREEAACGMCDWCKSAATTLRDHRDFEEGSCGRVYQVCQPCRQAESARLREEMDEADDSDPYFGED